MRDGTHRIIIVALVRVIHYISKSVCVVIPFILYVRLLDAPTGVTQ